MALKCHNNTSFRNGLSRGNTFLSQKEPCFSDASYNLERLGRPSPAGPADHGHLSKEVKMDGPKMKLFLRISHAKKRVVKVALSEDKRSLPFVA